MDPDACLLRLIHAMADSDRDDTMQALEDLETWLRKGGFLPSRRLLAALLKGANA